MAESQTTEEIAAEDAELMRCTADALAMPFLACRRRMCRRGGFCQFWAEDRAVPRCLSALSPEARAVFDQVYGMVLAMLNGHYPSRPSGDLDILEMELTASRIVVGMATTWPRYRRFDRWLKDYVRPPAPQIEPGFARAYRSEFERITAGDRK